MVIVHQYPPNNIRRTTSLLISMPNIFVIISAMRGQTKLGLRCLISTIALIKSLLGPLGPGFPFS